MRGRLPVTWQPSARCLFFFSTVGLSLGCSNEAYLSTPRYCALREWFKRDFFLKYGAEWPPLSSKFRTTLKICPPKEVPAYQCDFSTRQFPCLRLAIVSRTFHPRRVAGAKNEQTLPTKELATRTVPALDIFGIFLSPDG